MAALGACPGGAGSNPVQDPSSSDRLRALLVLKGLPGVGDRRIRRLLDRFGSAPRALAASAVELERLAGKAALNARGDPENLDRAAQTLEECRDQGVRVVPRGAPLYPASLHPLHDPPAVLFLRGDPALLSRPAVAVVGARRATAYGRRVAERLGTCLAGQGVVVVSGLALGIDGAAHRGALSAGGDTVAVLGAGVNVPHPPSHKGLFARIAEAGLLVSEFFPDEPPLPHHFPRRNRLIAALSAGVVVVEAARKSGALITVDHALDLGREVFAVPGPVDSPQSEGVHALIRDGAHILSDLGVVPEELGWQEPGPRAPGARGVSGPPERLGSDARTLWRLLERGALPVDQLVRGSELGSARALAALSELEIQGFASQRAGGWFELVAGKRYGGP